MHKAAAKIRILFFLFITVVIIGFSSFHPAENTFDQTFKNYFTEQNALLLDDVIRLFRETEKKEYDVDSAKNLLSDVRRSYKKIEPFTIYFFPGDARLLNRVIINEIEEDDKVSARVIHSGIQYIEMMLYGDSAMHYRRKIKDEVDEAYKIISRFNELINYSTFRERDVFEAMQMHLVRQFMLAFANFETVESRTAIPESVTLLKSYKEFAGRIYPPDKDKKLLNDFNKAIDDAVIYLEKYKAGSEPDYFTFYSQYYIPVSGALVKIRDECTPNNIYNITAINYHVRSVFDPGAFNSFYFLPAQNLAARKEVIELGHTLFFDPALSANNLRACASCHQPGKAFTDGLAISDAFEPGKKLTRNAPTIINAVLQRKLFYDGRAFTFEDQAGAVMSNPLEMHNDFSLVAGKLNESPKYVNWFKSAFVNTVDTQITSRSILIALSEYERSLIGLNSRFDKTISGRENLLNEDEKEGFNLFMGKANCGSCHFLPLFNGVMPPEYVETEWEILGVPASSSKRQLDADIGRAKVINVDVFMHAFKSPTLRNIELTAPYMHNGVFITLEEVMEFYDAGGGTSLGYEVPLQTLPADSLHLTQTEKFKIIAFMKSLTDTVNLTYQPKSLPGFPGNPKLDARPIGGEY